MMPMENKAVTVAEAPIRVTLARPWDGHATGEAVYVPADVARALHTYGITR